MRPHILNIYCVRGRGTIRLLYNIVIFCPHHYLSVFTHKKKVRLKGKGQIIRGVQKKVANRMLLEPRCTSSITSSRHPLEMFFARFLLRLSRIKRSQDILMGQFSPTALNFCYYFYLLVLFLGHPVDDNENENYFQSQHLLKYGRGYDGQIV